MKELLRWSILSQILSCLLQPPPPLTHLYSLLQSCAPVCVCMRLGVCVCVHVGVGVVC